MFDLAGNETFCISDTKSVFQGVGMGNLHKFEEDFSFRGCMFLES